MNLKTCMTMMVLSVMSLGSALADNQDLGSQQGFISGGPGTTTEDQDVTQQNQQNQQQNNNTQSQSGNNNANNSDTKTHEDDNHPVLPVPMN